MKIKLPLIATILTTSFCFAQSGSQKIGSLEITNDGVYNTIINSGNVARMNMGYDNTTGFINFGTHTGNGQRDNILYMRGSDGNVGIGTTTPNSRLDLGTGYGTKGAKLLIYNDDPTNELSGTKCGFYMDNFIPNNLNLVFPEAVNHPGLFTISAKNTSNTTLKPYFSIAGLTGNIGIGTTNPSAILDINSPIPTQGRYKSQKWSTSNLEYNLTLQTIWDNNGINQEFVQRFNGVDYSSLAFYGGNVGIGISKPDEKLTVNGKIHAQEIRIDLSSPMTKVPDYVFASDYKLKSLQEVEEFIKQNSHLPEIPSAKEIEKNGLLLAEMNMNLLKKIEEMTLYMIEMKKENETMKKENKKSNQEIEALKKENEGFKSLSERLTKIENQLK